MAYGTSRTKRSLSSRYRPRLDKMTNAQPKRVVSLIASATESNHARLYPIYRWNNPTARTPKKNDAETLTEIRKALEVAGAERNDGQR